eukprot:301911-Pyramimonas_sp.AAC.1
MLGRRRPAARVSSAAGLAAADRAHARSHTHTQDADPRAHPALVEWMHARRRGRRRTARSSQRATPAFPLQGLGPQAWPPQAGAQAARHAARP